MARVGWIVKSKGNWYITEEGKQAAAKFGSDPGELNREARRLYKKWKASRPDATEEDDSTPEAENAIEAAAGTINFEEAEETAWTQIEKHVQTMNPYDFQKLVAALLKAMGYQISWIAPPGPDRGVDIVAHLDPLGTSSPRIKVQVKRRTDKADVDGLRTFMAVLSDHDVGIYVCSGGFTSNALVEARTKETRKLTLIDLDKFVELWVEYYDKVPDQDKYLLPLKPIYYLAPLSV